MAERSAFALVIATSDYTDPTLRKLEGSLKDADALENVLKDPAIGAFSEVRKIVNKDAQTLRQEIDTLFSDERKATDLLLLYFSGHGVVEKNGELYFTASDTRTASLRATGIPTNYIKDAMRGCRSRKQILILDCCYAGRFAQGPAPKADERINLDLSDGEGSVVITASSSTRYSYDGQFTPLLVEALRSGAADANGNGVVTVNELYDYVREQVRQQCPQQVPQITAYSVEGSIAIARNPHPPRLPAELVALRNSTLEVERLRAVEELGKLVLDDSCPLKGVALRALSEMTTDPSQRVREAAARFVGTQRPLSIPSPETLKTSKCLSTEEVKYCATWTSASLACWSFGAFIGGVTEPVDGPIFGLVLGALLGMIIQTIKTSSQLRLENLWTRALWFLACSPVIAGLAVGVSAASAHYNWKEYGSDTFVLVLPSVGHSLIVAFWGGILGWAGPALLQWLVLRRKIERAGAWILSTGAIWVIANVCGAALVAIIARTYQPVVNRSSVNIESQPGLLWGLILIPVLAGGIAFLAFARPGFILKKIVHG